MRKPYTVGLSLFAAVLCFVHYVGHEYDPIYMLFYGLSVPSWFAPAFGDITRISIAVVYALTIASYAFFGYIIDFFIARSRNRQSAS